MVPQPFLDIAQHCLRRDPLQRWTTAQTAGCLNPAPIEVAAPATPEATEEKITPPEGNVGGQQILLGGSVQELLVSPASPIFSRAPHSPRGDRRGVTSPAIDNPVAVACT